MPNTNWSKLNKLQIGRYAEYFAMMEFASYGFEVYTSEVDDHGIDFVVKTKDRIFLEVQVKSIRKSSVNYVFMQKDKWDINSPDTYLALLLFEDGKLPEIYLVPAIAWKAPNALFCDKNYEGLKSKPEYGLNLSKKNMPLLGAYKLEVVLEQIGNSSIFETSKCALHEAMRSVLSEAEGNTMHAADLTDEIFNRRLYLQKNGEKAQYNQIRARCGHYLDMFDVLPGNFVKLKMV